MLAKGLRLFSATLFSVVKQGWGTGCLVCSRSSPEASGAWDLDPPGASLYLFVQPRPCGDNSRMLCVCVWCWHTPVCTNTIMAGQIIPGQTISYSLLLQLPKVSEAGWWGDLGTSWVGTTCIWGSCSSWPLCSNHLATANLCTLQKKKKKKSHLENSCQHMQVRLVQNQEASPQIPEVGKKIIYCGLICFSNGYP